MKPSIKKGIIITSVCAFTLVGIKFYLSSSNTVEVHSVSSLNTGYWDNPATSTGLVSNSDTQSVLYDSSKTITQVFVKEGQQVSVGDPLLSYDLTTLQSAVDTSQLEVEKAQNAITLANHELKKLLNTFRIMELTKIIKFIFHMQECLNKRNQQWNKSELSLKMLLLKYTIYLQHLLLKVDLGVLLFKR